MGNLSLLFTKMNTGPPIRNHREEKMKSHTIQYRKARAGGQRHGVHIAVHHNPLSRSLNKITVHSFNQHQHRVQNTTLSSAKTKIKKTVAPPVLVMQSKD